MFIVNQCRPAQVNLRAARRLAERERTAPHAKLLSRRGFMGQRPQLRVHTSKLYGKMMRRLIDTECRQVCELQHTQTVHRDETYKAHRRFRARKRGGGTAAWLSASGRRRRPSPRQGGGLGVDPPTTTVNKTSMNIFM